MSKLTTLESKMVTYQDLLSIPSEQNSERLVALKTAFIPNAYRNEITDMKKILMGKIYVRQSILTMLEQAQLNLEKINPNLTFYVTYGYRSPKIQTKLFLSFLQKEKRFFLNPTDLYDEIHRYVAVPTVAGHPTGGAIDILIYDKNTKEFLDFGAEQYDFKKENCYVFSPTISKKGTINRQLLRSLLLEVGFAPFDGEWWHFSYGDKEWAFYYQKQSALYDQIDLSSAKKFML